MKKNTGLIVAVTLSLLIIVWIASGVMSGHEQEEAGNTPVNQEFKVQAQQSEAEAIPVTLTLNGQTQANRSVSVLAEASGKVISINASKGDQVKKGQVLLRLDQKDLPAQLKSAEALENQRRLEYQGALRLKDRGLQNETEMASAEAQYRSAQAQTASLKLQLEDTEVTAPFDGYLNTRTAELGAYISAGTEVAGILDFSPMLMTAQVSEKNVRQLTSGQHASIELINGRRMDAVLTYIAAAADPATRTFRTEFRISQPVEAPLSGTTAKAHVDLGKVSAHFISPALLMLDEAGRLGIRTLSGTDTVEFYPVEIVESTPSGVWVTGLPQQVRIITVGQGFVETGQQVHAEGVSGSDSNGQQ